MSVRWKPLVILSGLFATLAVAGFLVFFLVFSTPDLADILAQARGAREKGDYEAAKIYYLQAIQLDGKNAEIHMEIADFHGEWLAKAKPEARAVLEGQRLRSLLDAARYDKTALEPHRALLAESLEGDDAREQADWAKKVVALAPGDPDARYVLVAAALLTTPPNLAEAQTHLDALKKSAPDLVRTAWAEAQIAHSTNQRTELKHILDKTRGAQPQADSHPIDRLCFLRLLVIDFESATEADDLAAKAAALVGPTRALIEEEDAPTSRVVEIGKLLKRIHAIEAVPGNENASAEIAKLDEALEAGFRRVLEKNPNAGLWLHQAHADHLLALGRREECLKAIQTAMASPLAKEAAMAEEVIRLHETALKAILADQADPDRFAKIEPHIQGLLRGPRPEHQGLGSLYKGAIALERSGLAGDDGTAKSAESAKLLAEARENLKVAAAKLPTVAAAQALYGVSLILSNEPNLGRQYLQTALRIGGLEARYQIWAAWSMLRADYPEEAEPIVASLQEAVDKGALPADLGGTLSLMRAEIAQARKSPEDLKFALTTLEEVANDGGEVPTGVSLRMAELSVAIEGAEKGLDKVMALRATGQGGAAAEHLAIATLLQLKRDDEAREILTDALARFPDSGPLAALQAGLLLRDEQPEDAEKLLADFVAKHPNDLPVGQLRARILADELDKAGEARTILNELADRTENSGPLVQLTMLELTTGNRDQAAQAIAKIRGRWPENAVGDMLDAQLSLARQDLSAASTHLAAALKKDPKNKVAQFLKAQVDNRSGDSAEAARIFEDLVRTNPVKELSNGLSLADAAQWAMGSLALKNNDIDQAITRYETILGGGAGSRRIDRVVRWKLVEARNKKGDWAAARKEIIDLLDDPEVTEDERVQAANYFRQRDEAKVADAQIDFVLKKDPNHPGAVVLRAYTLTEAKKFDEAAKLLESAIASGDQPVALYMMLAGVENARGPADEVYPKALAALDKGLLVKPGSLELVRTKYNLIRGHDGADAAIESLVETVNADTSGALKPLLVDAYRKESRFAEARGIVEEQVKADPKNARLAGTLVGLVASQASRAASQGDREEAQKLDLECASLIKSLREQFPSDPRFVQADCELAIRQGDFSRAESISLQLDQMDVNTTLGPVLRAKLYERQGWTQRALAAYVQALGRDPQRDDIRLKIADLQLGLGHPDEALAEAEAVLRKNPSDPRALLMSSSALAAQEGAPEQVAERREAAIRRLVGVVQAKPDFPEAYHKIAEIHVVRGRVDDAVATLKAALKATPGDSAALAMLVQYLTQPGPDGTPASASRIEEARSIVEEATATDQEGYAHLAAGVGFYKSGQYALALPWTEQAAEKLDDPVVHTTLGDLLMMLAEEESDPIVARPLFERSVAEYDKVLAVESRKVEAVNNKAWILHEHLGRDEEALNLVEGLLSQVERNTLPPEFFDTVGAIREALGRPKDAEDAYSEGLGKAPAHPILNLHMGRLLASDTNRAARAGDYLSKALESRADLGEEQAAEAEALLKRIGL
jgi:tetratricopeptide (TPR) repeat protein